MQSSQRCFMKSLSFLKSKFAVHPASGSKKSGRPTRVLASPSSTPTSPVYLGRGVTLGSPSPHLSAPSTKPKTVVYLDQKGLGLLTHQDLACHGLPKGLVDNLRFSRAAGIEEVGARLHELIGTARALPSVLPVNKDGERLLSANLADLKSLTSEARQLTHKHVVSTEMSKLILDFLDSIDKACDDTTSGLALSRELDDDVALDDLMASISLLPQTTSLPEDEGKPPSHPVSVSRIPQPDDQEISGLISSIRDISPVSSRPPSITYVQRSVPTITAKEYALNWEAFWNPVPPALRDKVMVALTKSEEDDGPVFLGGQLISARQETVRTAFNDLDRQVETLRSAISKQAKEQGVKAVRSGMTKLETALKKAGFHEEARHIALASNNPAGYNQFYGQRSHLSQDECRKQDLRGMANPGSTGKNRKLGRVATPRFSRPASRGRNSETTNEIQSPPKE